MSTELKGVLKEPQIVAAMRKFADQGLPVIPCKEKEKIPLIKGWQMRCDTSSEEVSTWSSKWPNMNMGLVLGSASMIIGIDIDGREALNKLKEVSGGELPETWSFQTPGGGKRLLYRIPQGAVAKKWTVKLDGTHSELSLLGEGCQTIIPPSIHPNGERYKWYKGKNPSDIEIAQAPPWVLDLMGKNSPSASKAGKDKRKTEGGKERAGNYPADVVFERLTSRCAAFREALELQISNGLSEEQWFRWIQVLVNSGHNETATDFSRLSGKHDQRSIDRIEKLLNESNGDGPMTRCTSFGCDDTDIETCFFHVRTNAEGDPTNSPGSIVKDMEALLPPTDPVYAPYTHALKSIPDYDVDSLGNLCGYDRKGNPFAICNFVAKPMLEVIRDDGVTEDRTFRMEGVLSGGRMLPPLDVSSAEFASMNWVLHGWGIGAAIRTGQGKKDMLRDAIQIMGQNVDRLTIFTHLGFRKLHDGKWIYLHAGGCIGSNDVTVETEKSLDSYQLPSVVDDPTLSAQASLKLLELAPHSITIPLLALVYLSPLTEAFRQCGLEPNFLIWLFGGTGTRKTSVALTMLSHFGKFATKTPPGSFKDTANALEKRAFATKDTLLVIDDYHPEIAKGEADRMSQTAQRVLRMYGDRIGRGRLKTTLELQKSFPPRGMALITGEDVPQGQSSVARFLGIELLQDDVNLDLLTWAQNNSHLFAESMSGYIRWLIPQMEELPKVLAARFIEERGKFQCEGSHGRLGEAAAWLNIGLAAMCAYMEASGVCAEETLPLIEEAEAILMDLVNTQGRLVNEDKPAELFLKVVNNLIATGKIRFESLSSNGADDLYSSGDMAGWEDESYYYILPDIIYNAVSRFLSSRGQRIPFQERTLWKHLDEAGLISTEVGSDGHKQRCPKKSIPKRPGQRKAERYRVLHLIKSQIQ